MKIEWEGERAMTTANGSTIILLDGSEIEVAESPLDITIQLNAAGVASPTFLHVNIIEDDEYIPTMLNAAHVLSIQRSE